MPSQVDVVKSLPTHPITFEEFLDWCDSDTRAEWVNGNVVLMSPVSPPHQRLVYFLITVVGTYVEERGLGEVTGDRILMKLDAVQCAREPDMLFISKARRSLFEKLYLNGPADMALEVVSRWSVHRDRREKLREYQAAGVREYWLIDPDRRTADFYLLDENRQYAPQPIADGVFHSTVIDGLHLPLEWLWEDSMPTRVEALRKLGVI